MKGKHREGSHLRWLCPCGPSLFPLLGEMQFIYVLTLLAGLENRWGTEKRVRNEPGSAELHFNNNTPSLFRAGGSFPLANLIMWLLVCSESLKITIFFPIMLNKQFIPEGTGRL